MGGTPDGPKSTGSSVSPGEGATFVRPVEPGTEDLHVVTPDLGPDLPPLRPGELLAGRFSIERFIARGGMGAVYEATDLALRSRVALKIIRSSILGDGAALERFRREVLLARKIAHRNVCHVYEFYETRTEADLPVHFLTMELLEGETLASRLHARGRMTPGEALPLVLQMCDGLAAAHDEGVVHSRVHGSGAGHRQRREPGDGHLFAGHRDVRDGDGRPALRG